MSMYLCMAGGPNQDTAYDIQLKGAIKSNGGQENRSAKDYSNVILSQRFAEKMRKYSELWVSKSILCSWWWSF